MYLSSLAIIILQEYMLVNVGVCKATAEITGFTGLHNSDGNSHHSSGGKTKFK